ncbi:Protein Mpv17 [Zea mays]|uniref:Protein Mpv17 n=1 Tax=Zea mays TaxID=4577 RepID=A0A3L6F0D3_MAIZE|nr:Protein Mpv17 [Zea mays]
MFSSQNLSRKRLRKTPKPQQASSLPLLSNLHCSSTAAAGAGGMAMASALPLLLAPRAVFASAGPSSPHLRSRRLALRLPPPPRPAALSAPPAAVQPREARRVQPPRAASCCHDPVPAAGGGARDWRMFLAWYLMALDKNPIVTKAVTSAALTLAGDLICQLVIDRVPELDLRRTFVFTFLGLALVGPTLHVWYLYLSKLVTISGASGAIARLILDQEWLSSVLANWQLWIPFQFLNFYFVPQKFQTSSAGGGYGSFGAAVALFNRGEYHACHDVVEELWYSAEDPARTLLHGLLQCAVGFHHLFNQNHRGAMMELGEGLCKLRKLQLDGDGDNDGGGPFSRFRDEIAAVLQFLYRTQKELAACTDELCLTMDGSPSSYQLLGNFAAGQQLYRLELLEAEEDGACSSILFSAPNGGGGIAAQGAAPRPQRVKLPTLRATEQHLVALQCTYEYT